jgi:hypothetical protein
MTTAPYPIRTVTGSVGETPLSKAKCAHDARDRRLSGFLCAPPVVLPSRLRSVSTCGSPMSGLATPALAIASYVRSRDGAASSAEILERFWISQSTLRRRRPELARLGIVFVENGNRSTYATRELTEQLPSRCQPQRAAFVDNAGHS